MEVEDADMMDVRIMKRWWGHLPVRTERERLIRWIGGVVGPGWLDDLWLSKWSGAHFARCRWGDRQVVQVYRRDKTWLEMPVAVWIRMSGLDDGALDEGCWRWIKSERERLGISPGKAVSKAVSGKSASDVLRL